MSVGIATAAAFEKEPSLVQEHALGALYETADGRRYRYGKVGVAPIVVGAVVEPNMDFVNGILMFVKSPAPRRGSTQIVVENLAIDKPANWFAGGLTVVCFGTGKGAGYRIDGHTLMGTGGGSTVTIRLVGDDPLNADLVVDDSKLAVSPSPYANLRGFFPDGTHGGAAVGVSIMAMPANTYGWIQTRGAGVLTTAGVAIAGQTRLYPVNTTVNATVVTYPSVGVSLVGIAANCAGPCLLTFE